MRPAWATAPRAVLPAEVIAAIDASTGVIVLASPAAFDVTPPPPPPTTPHPRPANLPGRESPRQTRRPHLPATDDPTLCTELHTALTTAEQAGDHAYSHQTRAIIRDIIHDLTLRARLRQAIAEAINTPDHRRAHQLRTILATADNQEPGWQADAYEALDDA